MPSPTRPNTYPIWTEGNNSARQQPTDGEQFTGFTPNFRPPSGWHNWLFGIMSDWIAWLDFITNGGMLPVSNVGHNILTGTTLQSQLDECDAFLSSLGLQYLTMTATGNPLVWHLSAAPLNTGAVIVTVDGVESIPTTDFSYAVISSVPTITFVSGAISTGQTPIAFALTANQPGSGGSSVSGGYVAYGSAGAPNVVTASGGITEPGDQRAMIFTVSSGGVTPITSNPQITAGTKVGQELRIIGTSNTDAIVFANGNGLLLNGPVTMNAGYSIDLYWNGSAWAESDRSN